MVSTWPVVLLINQCTSGHLRKARLLKHTLGTGVYLKFAGIRKVIRSLHVLPTTLFVS